MKALPQASAGHIFHIGIIAGKLNGVIPATTPSGWRIEYMSMPGPARVGELALQQVRRADADLGDLEAAGDVALGVGQGLAVLAATAPRPAGPCRGSGARRSASSPAPAAAGWSRAQRGCARSAPATAASSSAAVARATRACTSPVAGLKTSAKRPERPGTRLPSMKWPMSCMVSPRVWPSRTLAADRAGPQQQRFSNRICKFAGRLPPCYKGSMQKGTMKWDDLRVFLAVARNSRLQSAGRTPRARPGHGRAADRRARGGARRKALRPFAAGLRDDRGRARAARARPGDGEPGERRDRGDRRPRRPAVRAPSASARRTGSRTTC